MYERRQGVEEAGNVSLLLWSLEYFIVELLYVCMIYASCLACAQHLLMHDLCIMSSPSDKDETRRRRVECYVYFRRMRERDNEEVCLRLLRGEAHPAVTASSTALGNGG